jgi:hypothetical protein
VNRLVSSATAPPIVPDKQKDLPQTNFSCLVEPPRKGPTAPRLPARTVESALAAKPASAPAVAKSPDPVPANSAAVAATTVPPFGVGGQSAAPFDPRDAVKFEFKPEKRPRARLLSWSVVLLAAACSAGYFQYQRMERAKAEAALLPEPGPAGVAKPTGPLAGMPTPFTALKQAKETIKDAGEKHKAAYDTVAAMMDDALGRTGLPEQKLAEPAKATPAPAGATVSAPTALVAGARLADVKGDLIYVDEKGGAPSRVFLIWATTVRIGGVRTGDEPRVLIGQAAYAASDLVDARRGIVFEGYDPVTQRLRFSEPSGAELLLRR